MRVAAGGPIFRVGRVFLGVALAGQMALAQASFPLGNPLAEAVSNAPETVHLKASQSPALSVSVALLGYSPPGEYYLGRREALLSLDFLSEDRLLFTFRVPGLLRRDQPSGWKETERQVRALVLSLPSGTVLTESLWTLHDSDRYLWMLPEGHFLLRDRNEIREGDASLQLRTRMRFSGQVIWLNPDPEGRYLAVETHEPRAVLGSEGEQSEGPEKENLKLQIVRREDGQVLLESNVEAPRHLSLGAGSYLTSRYGQGLEWQIARFPLTGGFVPAGKVRSSCAPTLDFLGNQEILASGCDTLGGHRLSALTVHGRPLWENSAPDNTVWPLLFSAANGSRVARESLLMGHPLSSRNPFSAEDVRSQLVEVFDAADGKKTLTVQAWPMLDGGGNVALSPSGKRVAVLVDGAIRIFDLPTVFGVLVP